MPKAKLPVTQAPVLDGDPTATPEPLVGEDRKTMAPVERTERIEREGSDEAHGAPAVVDLALDRAVEADQGDQKDAVESAEAVDASNARLIDIERAELDAATHAEQLRESGQPAGREFVALEDAYDAGSPHGRAAEADDPWAAARWAPHGDQNVPAESYGENGVLGTVNPAAADQARGLEGDSDADVARAKKEAGPGQSIARERSDENRAAKRTSDDER